MSSSFSFLVLSVLVVLLSLCASVSGKPLYANHSLPSGWSHVGRAPSTSYHTVTLALVQRNMAALVEAFHNRTDPFHPQYQQWMSASELHSYTALPASSVQSILDWLTASGIGQASSGASVKYVAGSDAIVVRAQVQHLEAAFSTELSSYTHHEMGSSIAQALNATSHLPDHVAPLVEMVRGLTNMPRKLTPSLTPDGWNRWKPADPTKSEYSTGAKGHSFHAKQAENINNISPFNVLAKWYGLPDRTSTTGHTSKASIGVYAFDDGYFDPNDLSIYSYLESATQNRSYMYVPPSNVLGAVNDPTNPAGEFSLDIQASTSVNPQATPHYVLDTSGGDWYIFALWVSSLHSSQSHMCRCFCSIVVAALTVFAVDVCRCVFQFQSFPNTQLPQTLTISAGSGESDYSCTADPSGCNVLMDSVPAYTYFNRMSYEFLKVCHTLNHPSHRSPCWQQPILILAPFLLCCVYVNRSGCEVSLCQRRVATLVRMVGTASATTPRPTRSIFTVVSRRRRPTCWPSVRRSCMVKATRLLPQAYTVG